MKKLYTAAELVAHMQSKGVLFTITSEEQAEAFLTQNNYYFKLAAYRNNYQKRPCGNKAGQYIHLEFAYLQELSKIDAHLRYLILQMCLDIEHSLKVQLLHCIENDPDEDGYQVIEKFIKSTETPSGSSVLRDIKRHKASAYCKDLIEKYYPDFPAWVFVELISFGTLVRLCNFYSERANCVIVDSKLLNYVRDIRNAAAHSNCLINKLGKGENKPIKSITDFAARVPDVGKSSRRARLSNQFINDFTALLLVYDTVIKSEPMKKARYEQLIKLFDDRMLRNKEYFERNDTITSAYKFLRKEIELITPTEN